MEQDRIRYQSVLETVLAVHRLLLGEQNLPALLQGVCDHLVAGQAYSAALIILLESELGGVITAETGMRARVELIMERLRNSQLPECCARCLKRQDGGASLCRECSCPMHGRSAGEPRGVITVAVCCRKGLTGFLVLEVPSQAEVKDSELDVVGKLSDTLAQALRRLFADEEARQREHELKRVEERFELALYASQAGLWDWNIKTGEMYTSNDHKESLDYRNDNGQGGLAAVRGRIHPDDQDRVLEVLNEHLAGKTDEYRIEYRVKSRDGEWKWFLDRGRVVERDANNMPVRMTGTHQDISVQKKQEEALAAVQRQLHEAVDHERSFLQTVIDGAGDPVMAIDLEYNVLLMNRAALELLHVDRVLWEREGKKCYQLFAGREEPCADPEYPCPVQEVRHRQCAVTLMHSFYHGNGINNTFELEVSPLLNKEGELYGVIEVARDVTDRLRIEKELRESRSRLYRLAHHDVLTGLPNRLLFKDRLEQAIFKIRRKGGKAAVLFLDLDRFKEVNDTLGHDVGDALLVEVAARFQRQCRQSDTVARIGGDEFVFILEEIENRRNAEVVAGKIMEAVERPVQIREHEILISTSIGIALYPDDAEDMEGVIKCADMALYQAKEEGRNGYRMYHAEMAGSGRDLQLQTRQMSEALEKGQFFLEYQCQLDLSSREIVGLEALLRWQHPEQGVIYPRDFLFRAEESGLIVELGQWVFEAVCRQVVSWRQEGLVSVPVAINISSHQLRHAGLQAMVVETLKTYDIPADLLEIELDESALTEGLHSSSLLGLEEIGRLGVRLAVEDFGKGRFSLGDLQRLPLSRLKIDSSFMARLSEVNIAVIVDAIIVLAHNLGITVLAEGVEREEQLQFLLEHNCDQAQGYYLARPAGADTVSALLKKNGTGLR